MNKITQIILLITSLVTANISLSAEKLILFGTAPDSYVVRALELALSYDSTVSYVVDTYDGDLPKTRAFEKMRNGVEVDVVFGGATIEREKTYLPIRYPLLKGLNGWRIPLIHKESKLDFTQVQSISNLKQYTAGSFYNWSDTGVLMDNELPVVKASNYAALYNMLDKKRFDYFPRSILEIDSDYNNFKHYNIEISMDLIVHYPTAYYFYVSKTNSELAERIESGVMKAHKDGKMAELFWQHHGDIIERYTKHNPNIIRLQNNFLSPETPLDQADLWFDLSPGK